MRGLGKSGAADDTLRAIRRRYGGERALGIQIGVVSGIG